MSHPLPSKSSCSRRLSTPSIGPWKEKCVQVGTRVVVWGPDEGCGVFAIFKLVM